jgi:hypothetical protein
MYAIDSKTIVTENGPIVIEILPDDDASPPSDFDCEPEFFRSERGADLLRKLAEEFAKPDKAYIAMAYGETYKTKAGDWYYGVTEYRHGGCALALCSDSRARCWPDRQWDVIDLVGWVKIGKKLREEWGIAGLRDVEEKARRNAEGCVKMWETYLNGGCCGYEIKRYPASADPDDLEYEEPLEEDSCWGFYSSEEAMEAALESI